LNRKKENACGNGGQGAYLIEDWQFENPNNSYYLYRGINTIESDLKNWVWGTEN
jgi:hypothetical protein